MNWDSINQRYLQAVGLKEEFAEGHDFSFGIMCFRSDGRTQVYFNYLTQPLIVSSYELRRLLNTNHTIFVGVDNTGEPIVSITSNLTDEGVVVELSVVYSPKEVMQVDKFLVEAGERMQVTMLIESFGTSGCAEAQIEALNNLNKTYNEYLDRQQAEVRM